MLKKQIRESTLSKHIECLTVEVENETGKNININCIYRPPDGNIKSFINSLKKNIFDPVKKGKSVFIAGDFNVDLLNCNKFKSTKIDDIR